MANLNRFKANKGLDNNCQTIINVADPVNAQDAATKNFASNATNLSSGTIAAARLPAFTGDATSAAGASVALSLDPGNNGLNFRDAQIRAINNGFNKVDMAFYTANAATPVERMRIDFGGAVLVNRTSAYSDGAIGTPVLQANAYTGAKAAFATIADSTASTTANGFVNPNGSVGGIATSGTSTSYVTSSDYRLKQNITPIASALEKVAALKPVSYTWKSDGSYGEGFIASELQEVCPLAVSGQKDAVDADGKPIYQGIDPSKIIGLLTAAIQEQQQLIAALQARLDAAGL